MNSRGAFIVLEGCDRSGKTTQSQKLVEKLQEDGVDAKLIKFPDRNTECGKMIDEYLRKKNRLSDQGIHLLFAANRWEANEQIEETLKRGTTLICDRYSFSGVAFSAAKGLSLEWCKSPEAGLIKPDLVFLLTLPIEAIMKRGGFGDERYEKKSMQEKVIQMYKLLKEDYWMQIDADNSEEDVLNTLYEKSQKIIAEVGGKPLEHLW
ncbi:Thymidylate kinase [Sergentomyia squamirostris]